MDTSQALFTWLDSHPNLKDFNIPLMSDRDATVSRSFGIIKKSFTSGQVTQSCPPGSLIKMPVEMRIGFPANSVFTVDGEDRVRHHTVLDSRVVI